MMSRLLNWILMSGFAFLMHLTKLNGSWRNCSTWIWPDIPMSPEKCLMSSSDSFIKAYATRLSIRQRKLTCPSTEYWAAGILSCDTQRMNLSEHWNGCTKQQSATTSQWPCVSINTRSLKMPLCRSLSNIPGHSHPCLVTTKKDKVFPSTNYIRCHTFTNPN